MSLRKGSSPFRSRIETLSIHSVLHCGEMGQKGLGGGQQGALENLSGWSFWFRKWYFSDMCETPWWGSFYGVDLMESGNQERNLSTQGIAVTRTELPLPRRLHRGTSWGRRHKHYRLGATAGQSEGVRGTVSVVLSLGWGRLPGRWGRGPF